MHTSEGGIDQIYLELKGSKPEGLLKHLNFYCHCASSSTRSNHYCLSSKPAITCLQLTKELKRGEHTVKTCCHGEYVGCEIEVITGIAVASVQRFLTILAKQDPPNFG